MTEPGRRDILRGVAGIAAVSVLPSVTGATPSIVDRTGQTEVTVEVGAEGNGGNFAFSPSMMRIDPGTTVVWEWVGQGGMHNVVAKDGSFESELQNETGATFKQMFESEGAYEYVCEPHQAMGMTGAVLVGAANIANSSNSKDSPDESSLSNPDYGDWFDDVDNFDGTVDLTGKKSITLNVGADANGGTFGFAPAAVRIDPGTTVTWAWTGEGGAHNVVAEDGSFESELYGTEGATFEHTFDEDGVTKYACEPHKMMGMKGAIVVGGEGGSAAAKTGLSPGELALGGSLVTALLSPIAFAVVLFGRRSNNRSVPTKERPSTQGTKRSRL
jgi:halocyanin-like protein